MLKITASILLVVISTFTTMDFVPRNDVKPEALKIASASAEAKNQLQSFRIHDDFSVHLFAAEPMMANPVAFAVGNQAHVWVCESFRQNRGGTDNRKHNRQWLERDISPLSVRDRINY
ncbi:MAG: hypothetical protein CMJ76_12305 [Planctomycetaceae bacterium]|nr:hypothetical protein [Planctomycetaceae bacterium]|tara:strand:+ start:70 stop:423 length:354 start_codon:yes stop_codon:yes gene_type:complete